MRNVMSWNKALEAGYEPRLYPFDQVAPGEYIAVLDFKIWAKKTMGIACYFTSQADGTFFQLTVYRRQSDHQYKLNGCDIDFTTCPTGVAYSVTVILNGKGHISFNDAATIP